MGLVNRLSKEEKAKLQQNMTECGARLGEPYKKRAVEFLQTEEK